MPLVLEYEDAMKRHRSLSGLNETDVDTILDYLCAVGRKREIYFLWRPFLPDPKDDLVLELAVEAGCRLIITHNLKDFRGVERFGVRAVSPGEFLRRIGVES